jgi:hypothetical protein
VAFGTDRNASIRATEVHIAEVQVFLQDATVEAG